MRLFSRQVPWQRREDKASTRENGRRGSFPEVRVVSLLSAVGIPLRDFSLLRDH